MQVFLHSYGDYLCHRNWKVERDTPSFHRLYYIRSGSACYYCGGSRLPLAPGHLYLFPKNVTYSILHDPDHPLATGYFHITTDRMVSSVMDCPLREKNCLLLMDVLLDGLTGYSRPVLEHLLSALLTMTLEEALPAYADPNLETALRFIDDNYLAHPERLTLENLAKQSCYSEGYFIRKFKQHTGYPPKQYILHRRLEKATELIGSHPLKEIAATLGFADYKNFRAMFKNRYGVSPSVFLAIKTAEI